MDDTMSMHKLSGFYTAATLFRISKNFLVWTLKTRKFIWDLLGNLGAASMQGWNRAVSSFLLVTEYTTLFPRVKPYKLWIKKASTNISLALQLIFLPSDNDAIAQNVYHKNTFQKLVRPCWIYEITCTEIKSSIVFINLTSVRHSVRHFVRIFRSCH